MRREGNPLGRAEPQPFTPSEGTVPSMQTDYTARRADLARAQTDLDAQEKADKDREEDGASRLILSFHPSDSLTEIATKLNALVGELGFGETSPKNDTRSATDYEKQSVRVATGQPVPLTRPGESTGGFATGAPRAQNNAQASQGTVVAPGSQTLAEAGHGSEGGANL